MAKDIAVDGTERSQRVSQVYASSFTGQDGAWKMRKERDLSADESWVKEGAEGPAAAPWGCGEGTVTSRFIQDQWLQTSHNDLDKNSKSC